MKPNIRPDASYLRASFLWCLAAATLIAAEPRPAPVNLVAEYTKQKMELNRKINEVNQWSGNQALLTFYLEQIANRCHHTPQSLAELKKKSALSYGDLVVAHALAKGSGFKFEQVKQAHRTMSWQDLAAAYKVKLPDLIEPLDLVLTQMQQADQRLRDQADKAEEEERLREERAAQRAMPHRGGYGGGQQPPPDEQ